MGTSIQSGSDILGAVATASGFALLLIWGIFWLTGIRIRRQKLRFLSSLLMAVTLSMLLGLLTEASSSSGGSLGGVFGNWVHVNCTLSGMKGIALALAWLAAFASLLLATDWLFIEYITGALGLKPQAASAPIPAGERRAHLFSPRPVDFQKPKVAPSKTADLPPVGKKNPVKAVSASPIGGAVAEEEEEAPPDDGDLSSLPWWSKGGQFAQPETSMITTEEEEESADAEEGEEESSIGIEEDEEAPEAVVEATAEEEEEGEPEERHSAEQVPKDEEEPKPMPPSLPEAKKKPEKSAIRKTAAPSPAKERICAREPRLNADTVLLKRAIEVVFERREASIALLLNCMNIGYSTAAKLIYDLEKCGVVTPPGETGLRKVMISPQELDRILEDLH